MMKTSLLIVEDNRGLQQMLVLEFEELGYDITATAYCSEALLKASQKRFDLALLDYNLPDGYGTDLMAGLHYHQPSLAVILCSGAASKRKAREAITRGAAEFLSKPVSTDQLNHRFQILLGQPID